MNTEKRNYAWLWPYIGKVLWLFQMFCIGIAMGLIAIWLRVNTPLGRWNIVLSLGITAVSYVVFTWMLSWLSFGWKILLGKLAGFRFVGMWFRWLYVERKKGKLRIRKAKNYNKQGICHMLPPEKEGERYSMLLYYCGGSIGCGIMALGGFTVFFFS